MDEVKVVILDDMQIHIEIIKSKLECSFPQINIVGEANSIQQAKSIIEKSKPHLVFLDIKMRDKKPSFELLDYFVRKGNLNFKFIFFSAYKDEFASRLLDYTYLGFLAKPINSIKLNQHVSKYIESFEKEEYINRIKLFLHLIKAGEFKEYWVPLVSSNDKKKKVKILISEILYIEADGNLSKVYLYNKNRPLRADKSLIAWEKDLKDKYGFVRISRSYFINDFLVNKLSKEEGQSNRSIIFRDNKEIEVERRIMNRYIEMKNQNLESEEMNSQDIKNMMNMLEMLFEKES